MKLETTPCTKKSAGACQHVIKKYYCAKNPPLKSALINLSFQRLLFNLVFNVEELNDKMKEENNLITLAKKNMGRSC